MLAAVPNMMQQSSCVLGVARMNIREYGDVILSRSISRPPYRRTFEQVRD